MNKQIYDRLWALETEQAQLHFEVGKLKAELEKIRMESQTNEADITSAELLEEWLCGKKEER